MRYCHIAQGLSVASEGHHYRIKAECKDCGNTAEQIDFLGQNMIYNYDCKKCGRTTAFRVKNLPAIKEIIDEVS